MHMPCQQMAAPQQHHFLRHHCRCGCTGMPSASDGHCIITFLQAAACFHLLLSWPAGVIIDEAALAE
jgi:hypothetical protein